MRERNENFFNKIFNDERNENPSQITTTTISKNGAKQQKKMDNSKRGIENVLNEISTRSFVFI